MALADRVEAIRFLVWPGLGLGRTTPSSMNETIYLPKEKHRISCTLDPSDLVMHL